MFTFVLWFCVLVGLCKFTRGWTRAAVVGLYLVGTVLVGI